MPCYHPITIRNNKPDKNPLADKILLQVPCGHCFNCKSEKRLSWFIRLYYEWQRCIDNNGLTFFLTLTYNNKKVPKINNDLIFSRKDVQNYIKRVRKQLCTELPSFDWKHNLKYFVSSEYGGKTHRPHYHILWFIPFPCYSYRVADILSNCWLKNGFTKFGSRNRGVVDSVGGLHYCAKYVCKDVYEDSYCRSLIQKYGEQISPDIFKAYLPFHLSSNNLGMYLLSCCDFRDLEAGQIAMPDSKLVMKKYKLPQYYDRKIFYDVKYKYFDSANGMYQYVDSKDKLPLKTYLIHDEFGNVKTMLKQIEGTPTYVLNDLGRSMKEVRFKIYLESAKTTYRLFQSIPDDYNCFPINYKFKTAFDNIGQIKDFVTKSLTEEEYVNYTVVYKGLGVSPDPENTISRSSAIQDYKTQLDLHCGYRPDIHHLQDLVSNCNYYANKVNLSFVTDLIQYCVYLCRLKIEMQLEAQELDYVDRKTFHLRETE